MNRSSQLAQLARRILRRLGGIERTLQTILRREANTMAVDQQILDAVIAIQTSTAQLATTVANFIATVDALVGQGVITPEVAAQILGTAQADKQAVDDANTALAAELAKLTPPPAAPAAPPAGNPGD